MNFRYIPLMLLVFMALANTNTIAQTTCTEPGQNPSTAFPVCGTSVFEQKSVTLCGGRKMPNPKCNNGLLEDVNPYYYRFTCFEAGTLGFMINPNSATSDYDWQVYDITNRDPEGIFTNPSWAIASNWSQEFGNTGTTTSAANVFECEGPVPQYSKMPVLIKGNTYILMVSHFTNTQAGYKLQFGGGTAVITDTTAPILKEVNPFCFGETTSIKLNKRMLCTSLAANGSDFEIVGQPGIIVAAQGVGCSLGAFDFEEVLLTLSKPLPEGKYIVQSKKGSDANTLLDICGTSMAEGLALPFEIKVPLPATLVAVDSAGCTPNTLTVTFSQAVLCSSLAADGSDFSISGPQPNLAIQGITVDCVNDSTRRVTLNLNNPVTVGGSYTIRHIMGTDGNVSVNTCGIITPPNQVTIIIAAKVFADFAVIRNSNCVSDTVRLQHPGGNGINKFVYTWNDGAVVQSLNTQRIFSVLGTYNVKLFVSNGTCIDSVTKEISLLDERLNAQFEAPKFACPGDTVLLNNLSTGPITSVLWDFGNGIQSTSSNPGPQFLQPQNSLVKYRINLIVFAANGCKDTATQMVEVPNNCFVAVPNAFTPNGDGLNDYLYPINAYKATNLLFKVFNVYGQLIWETRDWSRKWDGRVNGALQQTGTYVWQLQFDLDGRTITQKGTTVLIR